MPLDITPYVIALDTNVINSQFNKHFNQGSTDGKFVITLLKDGQEKMVGASAKITMILRYGIIGTQSTKGSYVLQPTDSGYNITINSGKIEIPFTEKITDAAGTTQMILKVDDTSTAYTYSMLYNIDENPAYTQQSTADNLPSYKQFEQKITDLNQKVDTNVINIQTNTNELANAKNEITTIKQNVVDLNAKDSQHDTDINKLKTDVSSANTKIDTKANLDMSNVGKFATAQEGDMFYKKNNVLEIAPLNINDNDKTITTPYSLKVPPNTLKLGENVEIHENGGFVENSTLSLGKRYLMLDYENDPDLGSKKPIYYQRGAKVIKHELQPEVGESITLSQYNLGTPADDHQTQAFYLNLIDPVTNLTLKVNINGKDVAYYPSKLAWDGKENGYSKGSGLQKFDIRPFLSSLKEYNIILGFKADSNIRVQGKNGNPYFAIDYNLITRKDMALMEDIKGSDTFKALTDTPNDYSGQANKFIKVKSDESGLEFTASSGTVNIDGVSNDDFLKKGVQAGLLQQDLADVDLDKLQEKGIAAKLITGITVGQTHGDYRQQDGITDIEVHAPLDLTFDPDHKNSVAVSINPLAYAPKTDFDIVKTEVERLKTDISSGDLEIYAWRGLGVPPIDDTKPYKAYYLHIVLLKDDFGVLNIPANAPEGAIFSVENNSRLHTLTLTAPSGETINGSNASFNCRYDTLNFFVKDGTDWVLVYGGVFPNNYDSMKSTIQAFFPNSLFTIADVQAQLKDRLHTFREIQKEFAYQLHTYDQIDTEMITRGFLKRGGTAGMQGDQSVPIGKNWAIKQFAANEEVLLDAQNKGQQYVVFTLPVEIAPVVKRILVNNQELEFSDHEFVDNELYYKVFIASATVDSNSPVRFKIEYNINVQGNGIELDDGTSDAASVKKINLKDGLLITKSDVTGEIDLSGGINFADGLTGATFPAQKIQSLDKTVRISNLNGVADLSAVNQNHNEGILAFLGTNELINSKFGKSKLYFSDIRVKGGMYVYADMQSKAFVIQDIDPQDDPNVSGGTTFIIAMYFDPGEQQDVLTQDGYIEISLVKNDDSVLLDTDGNPMAVRIEYKAGDVVKPEIYIGEVQAKAYTDVHMKIHPVFTNEEIIIVGSNTCLCLQSISKEESSGMALLSFMAFTGVALKFDTRYYGFNSMNLAQSLIFPVGESDIPVGVMDLGNNMYINNQTPVKMSIQNNHLTIKDDGTNIPVFSITKFYDSLDSHYISNKQYKISTTITNKDNGFDIAMLEYIGTETPTPPKVESYNNGSAVFTTGWDSVDALFVSENPTAEDAKHTKTITVPSDSKGIAIVMYPISSEIPTTLILKDLEGDITPWFNKTIITDNLHIREKYLEYMDFYYTFNVNTPVGLAGYRYTSSDTDTKVPVGIASGGDGKVINDNSWHDAGSNDPNKTQGDFKFLVDGIVKSMTYEAQCYNEQGTINSVEFWLAKVNGDGTFTEVPNSRIATTIEANRSTPKLVSSAKFNFEVKANESYRMFMKSDKADGFYIQSGTNGVPLFTATIEFDEITTAEKSILDQLTLLDQELVITKDAQDANCYIELDFKAGKPVLTAKQR